MAESIKLPFVIKIFVQSTLVTVLHMFTVISTHFHSEMIAKQEMALNTAQKQGSYTHTKKKWDQQ